MSDEPTPDIDASNFDTLFVDGAYLNFKEEYMRFLLYRDVSIPVKMDDGSVKFGGNRREVLQEIRMPYVAADTLRYNLDIGLPLHATYAQPTISESSSQLLKSTLMKQGRFIELVYEMGKLFWSMDKTGQEKAAAILLLIFWITTNQGFSKSRESIPERWRR